MMPKFNSKKKLVKIPQGNNFRMKNLLAAPIEKGQNNSSR